MVTGRSVRPFFGAISLLVVSAFWLFFIFTATVPDPNNPDQFDGLRIVAANLRRDIPKGAFADYLQDIIGARALLNGSDPYPILGPANEAVGHYWPVDHRSTHPPTAFLLALPFAWLPWPDVAAVWTTSMLLLLALCGVLLRWGLQGVSAMLVLLAWPAAALSLLQFTPVWAFGLTAAWRFQKQPLASGMLIGLASLTKFLPALALTPFLLRRQWSALVGFLLAWAIALALLLFLSPGALHRYIEIMPETGGSTVSRLDNGALFVSATRDGIGGLVLAGGTTVWVLGRLFLRAARGQALDRISWGLWVWLTVAFLPILWDYSLLPLAPFLLLTIRNHRPLPTLFAVGALATSNSDTSAFCSVTLCSNVALSLVFMGLAFCLEPNAEGEAEPVVVNHKDLNRPVY
jgi:hypothetical protein